MILGRDKGVCLRRAPSVTPGGASSQRAAYIPDVFWLVYQTPRGQCVVLQPAGSLIQARFGAAMKKIEPGRFVEGYQLENRYIRKIPQDKIGKCLSQRQAQQLLKKLSPSHEA